MAPVEGGRPGGAAKAGGVWARVGTAVALMLLPAVGPAVPGLIGVATAQSLYAQVAAALRVEWQQTTSPGGRNVIAGYVYNDSAFRIGGVRLRVEILDSSNQVVGESFAWVYGNVPSRGRWGFSIPPPKPGEAFRVTVESFHLVAREGPSESP